MICIPLHQGRVGSRVNLMEVDYEKFDSLYPDLREVSVDWLRGAMQALERDNGPFKAFLNLWIGFNSWYACTVDAEREATQITSLSCDPYLNELFSTLATDNEYVLRVQDFVRFWPIFDVKALRRRPELLRRTYPDRQARVGDYIDSGVEGFQPRCWRRAGAENADCQVDWQHTFRTIYRVRWVVSPNMV